MSGHYQGKIALRNEEYLIPEEHKERPIGMSTNLQHSRDTYAAVIALVRDDSRHGRFDGKANAERLQVCWNVCANLSTTDLEAGLLNDMHRLLWAAYEEMEEMLITLADTDYNDIKANAICDNIGIVLAKIPETPK